MVAGLEVISKGEVSIGDRVVNDVPPKDRDIAMVFQNYALYPHMTVFDNMAFGLKLQKVPQGRDRTSGCRRPPASSGSTSCSPASRRRSPAASASGSPWAGPSCAIPQAFLMDEPLSNLDAKLRVQMRSEIARIQHELGRHDASTSPTTRPRP